ncbi:MAG: hypothetical protein ABI981_04590 [Betaproteobacteria bacterium]
MLALALLVARRAARARRKKLADERERARRKRPKYKARAMSDRAEMRAYDDPSTLADMTTRGSVPSTTQNPLATTASGSRPRDGSAGRDKRSYKPGSTRPTGKRSRADGKSGA